MSKVAALSATLLAVLVLWIFVSDRAEGNQPAANLDAIALHRLQRWNALASWLQLSEEQKTKIKTIAQDARQQARSIRANDSLSPQQKRERLRELRAKTRRQIRSVLTPQQQKEWDNLRRWMWLRWQLRKAYVVGKASKALGLTPQQEESAAKAIRALRLQQWKVWKDPSLSPLQKRQRLNELRQKQWNALRQQLTPEQMNKLDALRQAIKKHWRRSL